MSSIDNRIVEMEFDNSQFEKGVATTMNSLSSLDNQLNGLSGSSFGSLSASVDQIADRFSNMGIVAMSIIENITDRVVNLGVNMVKSMSVDQIAAGLQKYEAITTSTVAIVNQADVSFEQASGYIEKLAWYADATSFDLATMVSALKTFASQGVELDKAIPVIMGIGNSVTFAGQSAKAGSAAFDAYAKAISTGYLDYRAWITLNRGLGITTMKLKQQLIDAAVAEDTLTKAGEGVWKTHEGLEVTLENLQTTLGNQKGKWATTAVLMRLFGGEYGNLTNRVSELIAEDKELTGWTLTLEEAYDKFGDQLKKEFGPELYELGKSYLDSATKARTFSEAVDAVKDAVSTSFSNIFTSIFGNPDEAIELWTDLNDFLVTTINGPISNFANILKRWHEIGGRNNLIDGIKDLYNAIKLYLEPLSNLLEEIKPKITANWLYDVIFQFSDFAERMRDLFSGKALQEWQTIENEIAEGIFDMDFSDSDTSFREWVKDWKDYLSIQERANNIINGAVDGLRTLKEIIKVIITPFKQLIEPIKYFANGLFTIASNIGSYISQITEGGKVTQWFADRLGPLESIIGFVSNAIKWLTDRLVEFSSSKTIGKAVEGIGKLVDGFHPLKDLFEFGGKIFENIAEGIKKIGKAISEHLTPIFGQGNSGSIISKAVLVLMALRKALETKGSFDFWKQMAKGVENFREIIENASDALESFVAGTRMKAFREMAVSVAIMAASLLVLASISYEDLAKGIAAIAVSIGMLQMEFKYLNSLGVNGKKSALNAASLIGIAAAVGILALSLKSLSSIDPLKALQGLVGVSALLWELVGVLKVTEKFKKTSLTSLIALSESVLILTASVAVLGLINRDTLIQGGIAVSALLVALLSFMAVLQNIDTDGFMTAMLGVVELSAALAVMSVAVIAMGLIPWDSMAKGLTGIAGLLLEIGVFAAAMKDMSTKLIAVGAGMVLIAAAMAVLSVSLMAISSLGLDNMTNALIGLGLALTEIGMFTYLLSDLGPKMIALGAGLTIMSAGILVLSAAFAVLAAIGLPGIGTALLAVLGALIAFGTAGAIIGGGAVVGMLAFAAGLAAISAALIVLGNALIKIATAMLIFKTAFGQTSSDVTTQFNNSSEQISKSAKNVEENVTTSSENIEKAVTESNDAIETDVKSTNTEIESSTSQSWLNMIQDVTGGTVDIQDLTNGMSTNVLGTFSNMNTGSVTETDAMTGSITDLFSQMNTDGSSEVDGMKTNVTEYFSGMGKDLTEQTSGIGSNLSISWKSIGHNLMEGLKQGIRNKWNNLLDTMASLGNQMQNTYQYTMGIYSPSRVFAKYGEYIDQGLINGINSYSNRVMDTTENLGETVLNSFSDPMKQVASIANSDFTISPKITPVLDTTNIQNGKNYLESMFSGRSLSSSINGNINANLSAMSGISGDIGSLKNEIARMVAGQLNETVLSQALANAMKNVDLYMDGAKVGKMITSYQSSVNRAGGI